MIDRTPLFEVLCGRNSESENIRQCNGNLQRKCMRSDFCCINHLSNQQVRCILSDLVADIYLNACPGSGKTEVVGAKSAYEVKRWTSPNTGIAILTFTNSAEDELRDRVASYLGSQIGYPHFLGTFTSWIHGYIANPFLQIVTGYYNKETLDNSIRIIDSDCSSDFLHSFETKYMYERLQHIKANEFYKDMKSGKFIYCGLFRDGQNILDGLLRTDLWREKELIELKLKFWSAGFATYEDVEVLTYQLLYEHQDVAKYVAKRFPIILIDECQDLSFSQLQIIKELHSHGAKIHVIGDLNQSIYEFRNIIPGDTENFIRELSMSESKLTENYRSCDAIVNASMSLLCKPKDSEGKPLQTVKNPLVAIMYQKGEDQQVLKIFEELIIESHLDLQKSRVIVRGISLKQKLLGRKLADKSINTVEDFARSIYLHNSTNQVEDYQLSVQLLGRALQRTFFVDSTHSNITQLFKPVEIESNEWRRLLIKVQNQLLATESLSNFDVTWAQWKALLQESLNDTFISDIRCLKGKTIKLGNIRQGNRDRIAVNTFIDKGNAISQCSIETIHSCKGMSLDAVLFMSIYKKNNEDNGSYWADWFATGSNNIGECNRLAYVAFSRAKQLLVLGIPNPHSSPLDESQRTVLTNAGFEIISV